MESTLESRYREILSRIPAARPDGFPITLLAVSKTQPVEQIEALYRLGHRDFGENYVQELVEKAGELDRRGCAGIRWHFIGHLQTNKVKMLMPLVHAIHAVDSERLAKELAKRWAASGRTGRLPVFVEVNIDQEPSKSGLDPQEVPAFVQSIVDQYPELEVEGLMCIPAKGSEKETRQAFKQLRELEKSCQPASLGFLSMGMSSDYPIALEEGATHIRVGTALFGARPVKA